MPVDTTKSASSSARHPRRGDDDLKEIDLKRLRGEISCAECRRLKLKCDKNVPCGSCVRRGCDSICPCGILSGGHGTRFILANTEHLHRKIAEMSHRIRQLEDGLAILQATVSSERHPLLSDELVKIKFGPEVHKSASPETPPPPLEKATEETIDALGTLTLGEEGETAYVGSSAGAYTLLLVAGDWDNTACDDDETDNNFPLNVENLANLFPFTMRRAYNGMALQSIESFLPTAERAQHLCSIYMDYAGLFFAAMTRNELLDSLLPTVYNTVSTRAQTGTPSDEGSDTPSATYPHALASFLFALAVGALLDISLPAYNQEAEKYYNLGRAALSLRSIYEAPSVESVQAIGLMATYHYAGSSKYRMNGTWCLMNLAANLAYCIGLHRDSARWNLDAETVQRRRLLFWEVFSADVSHSLAVGLPPAIDLNYVDCEFPIDTEAFIDETGKHQEGFARMRYMYCRDIYLPVTAVTLAAKAPSYSVVLDLDRQVREASYYEYLRAYAKPDDPEYHSSSASMRSYFVTQLRTITMLYLHRNFFVQAMLEHPDNPLQSRFAPSFLTAYRCASIIVRATAHQFDRCADIVIRIWRAMYHTFTAAVIVGSVATRSRNSHMAASALVELGLAVDIFERASAHSKRAKIALTVLRRMKLKADASNAQPHGTPATTATAIAAATSPYGRPFSPSPFSRIPEPVPADELAIFGSQTKVITRRSRTRDGARSASTSTSSPQSAQPGDSPSPTTRSEHDVASPPPSATRAPNVGEYFAPPFMPPAPAKGTPIPGPPLNIGDKGTTLSEMYSSAILHQPLVDEPVPLAGGVLPQFGAPDGSVGFDWGQLSPFAPVPSPPANGMVDFDSVMASVPDAAGALDGTVFADGTAFVDGAASQDMADLNFMSGCGTEAGWLAFMQEFGILDS